MRLATVADFQEMHRVRTSVLENRLRNPASVQLSDYAAILERGGRGWVAELEGRIVGLAVADLERSNVWALFVDPRVEGRGIGRLLHDAMMDWMFAAGSDHVWLNTEPGTRAEGFYRAAQWRHAGSAEPSGEVRFEMTRERWLAGHRKP